jgi:hypothetical protein
MLRASLRNFLSSYQPFPAFLATLSGGLSLWFTIRFCRTLWPVEAWFETVALGILWEAAKLYFGPLGLRGLTNGSLVQRAIYLPIVMMTLCLMAGSVIASFGFTTSAEAQSEERSRTESQLYQRQLLEVATYNSRIVALSELAQKDLNAHYRSRAKDALDQVDLLQRKLDHLHEKMTLKGDLGALGPRIQPVWTQQNRDIFHLAVAILLEVIAVAASLTIRTQRSKESFIGETRRPIRRAKKELPTNLRAPARLPAAKRSCDNQGPKKAQYASARTLILTARVLPTYRDLKVALKIGQECAKRILADLNHEGVIQRVGRQYRLVAS